MKTGWISSLTFLNNRKKCQPILGTHTLKPETCDLKPDCTLKIRRQLPRAVIV